jgi:hypothetical protein
MTSQIELLSNKFNILLTQYQETYQEFITVINSESDKNLYTNIQNSSYIGESNINIVQNSTLDNCLTLCKSNKSCSGATFDNNDNSCVLTSGAGNVINANDKTAIVKQALFYSYKLKSLNEELFNINNSINDLTESKLNTFNNLNIKNKGEILNNNYQILQTERFEIEKIIREYETLNSAYEDGTINVTSNYYNYVMYAIVVLFLFLILLRFNFTGNQMGGGNNKSFTTVNSILLPVFLFLLVVFNSSIKK